MTQTDDHPRPVVLCILDGWGERAEVEDNAIRQARTPTLDALYRKAPHALIDASELEVGLPSGQMGNSEVGHMNLGAGRVVLQELPRIDRAFAKGEVSGLAPFQEFVRKVKAGSGRAHLLGLMSPGGVHSHQSHFAALAELLVADGLEVFVHAFLDGRDTPPRSAEGYLEQFSQAAPSAQIATVTGRYYAMDRDRRWERVAKAYEALVEAKGESAKSGALAVEQSYAADTSDEFVLPTIIQGYEGMKDGDGLLMVNFRADRVREILHALLDPAFDGFARSRRVNFSAALGVASYSTALDGLLPALFEPQDLRETLGEVVSSAGRKQLRIAETEKYAHVTFFLNGGREEVFEGEERILVPSPKVATYDLKPEMSAPEVTDELVKAMASGVFDLIVVNYANGDMVGHSGKLGAAIKAVECVDACLGKLLSAVEAAGGCLLITADHGNAEQMSDAATGQAHTAHTMNRVPIILANAPRWVTGLASGRLADVAPSVLELMGLPQPSVMTGRSLLEGAAAREAAAE